MSNGHTVWLPQKEIHKFILQAMEKLDAEHVAVNCTLAIVT